MKKSLLKLAFAAALLLLATPWAGQYAAAQTRSLTGTVVDHNGNSVVGAAVILDGTTNGTSTGADGSFTLNNVRTGQTITVSYIGYETQTLAIGAQMDIRVVLAEDAQDIEGVVVVGYGVQRKSDVTGAIASVKSEDLAFRSVETVQQALQGKAAGVQVYSVSARPGASPSIRIRGISSNSSDASNPLYVVDGLKVGDISYLDPNTIESMELLKDGASAAIYGAEAGNGVVLITTKQGRKGEGRVFYDYAYGITSLARKPKFMNAEQYIEYQTKANVQGLREAWDGVTDTDWADALYGDGGSFQRHTAGFETASDKGSMYTSLSYTNNDGMYYGNKDYMKRLTFQVNGTYQIKPWLQFFTNNSIESSRYSNVGDGIGQQHFNSPYMYDPLTPLTYPQDDLPDYMNALVQQYGEMMMQAENGDYVAFPRFLSASDNPLTWYYSQNSKHKDFNVRGIAGINFMPIKDFVFTSRVGYRLESKDYRYDGLPVYLSVSSRQKLHYEAKTETGRHYDWENFANYSKTFGLHNFNVMAGMAYHYGWTNFTQGTTDMFQDNASNFHYLKYAHATAIKGVDGEELENSSISYFGRVGYNFDDRYNVQVNFRADAYDSSKLAKESRWGYFPSVSAGWTITNEKFMESVSRDILSFAKLRGSWGVNGNVNVLSGYKYASSLVTSDYYIIGGSLLSGIMPSDVLANPTLQWEESKQIDIGIDTRFLADRLHFTMDYFDKNTTGQLIDMKAPLSSGTNNIVRNVGKVNNHGFEFELGWQDRKGDFYYSLNANMATLKNKVISLGGNSRIGDGYSNGMVYFDEGQPVWSFYGYKYLGVDPDDGSAIYYDKDESGTITEEDKVFLGSAIPDFTYGITFTAAYKGFDFTVFGSGSSGGKLMINTRDVTAANRPAELWTKAWKQAGDNAKYPKPNVVGDTHMRLSSMQLYDASYFKIKQIQLGYTLPKHISNKFFVQNLRVYCSLDNFFCITRYPGMDPESINATSAMGMDYGDYPIPKIVTFGVNISF